MYLSQVLVYIRVPLPGPSRYSRQMMEIRAQAVMAALEMAALETAKVAATAATTAPEIMIVAATMDRVETAAIPVFRPTKTNG